MLYSLAPSLKKFKLKLANTIDLKKIFKDKFSQNLRHFSITEDNLKFLPQEFQTFSFQMRNQSLLSFMEKEVDDNKLEFKEVMRRMEKKGKF